jgi:hypothetical protein
LAEFIFGVLLKVKALRMKEIRVVGKFRERYGGIDSGKLGFVAAHPWHKNKDVPGMGHPGVVAAGR